MTRSPWTLAAAPLLALTLLGAGCGGDDGNEGDGGTPTEQEDSERRMEPGSQTNSDESRLPGDTPSDDELGESDGGAGAGDGEDYDGEDDGTNRDTDAPRGSDDDVDSSDDTSDAGG